MKLCAARAAQLLNIHALAVECGISVNTTSSWLVGLEKGLEKLYIIKLLRPHHANFTKRLVKTPKHYCTDTGVLCHLLGIQSAAQLRHHRLTRAIFENVVLAEIQKKLANSGQNGELYFWRDSNGNEIDALLETGGRLFPIEI